MTAIIDEEIITELSGFKSRKTGDSFAGEEEAADRTFYKQ